MLSKENQEILNDLRSMADAGTLQGMFSDIPAEVYHAGPALSSSQVKPYYARLKDIDYSVPNDSSALRFGTAFHTYILENELFSKQYKVGLISNDGRESISPNDMELIRTMAHSFRANSNATAHLAAAKKELTFYSTCPTTGILQKARLDMAIFDDSELIVDDVKTTSSLQDFQKSCRKYLYKISLAYYLKVAQEVIGQKRVRAYLIACTKTSNSVTKMYEVSQRSLHEGHEGVVESLNIIQREREIGQGVWTEIESQIKEIAI